MAGLAVSVAIPALNEEHFLPILLRSPCAQRDVALDVVVVEGNSTDRTVEVAHEVAAANSNPDVEIRIFTVEKRNVSYQRNYAVARTRFDLLLFLDADIRIDRPYWIRNVVRKHLHRSVAVASCRFIPVENSRIAHLYYGMLFVFHQVMRWITPYAMGAMLLTSREMFDRVGGFDTELLVNEDANFVKRIARCGRFEVFADACRVSARRFLRGGFFNMGLMYLRIFAHRTIHGECQGDLGYWDERKHDAPTK